MGEVFVEGGPRRHAGLLEFDHHPGQAIDEADQIGPAGVQRTSHAELAHQQKIVVVGLLPIHHTQAFGFLPAVFLALFLIRHRYRDAFLEQPIQLAIGRLQAHRRAVARQLIDGIADRLRRQRGVELAQRGAQALHQHRLASGLSSQQTTRAKGLLQRRQRLPTERCKQPDGGLLDELVFGVGVGAHVASMAAMAAMR